MHEKARCICQTIMYDASMMQGMHGLDHVPPSVSQGSIQGLFENSKNTASDTYHACVGYKMPPQTNQGQEHVPWVFLKPVTEALVPNRLLHSSTAHAPRESQNLR